MATPHQEETDPETQSIQSKYCYYLYDCDSCHTRKIPYDEKKYAHLSDVTIKVGERKFKCHRFQLTRHSDVFDQMFRRELKEIEINDFHEETVENFIMFLYSGTLEKADGFNKSLMELAQLYDVTGLVDRCAEELAIQIENGNLQAASATIRSVPSGTKCKECGHGWNFYPYEAKKDQHLSDFTIKVGDAEFAVNKLKLSLTSGFFDKIFREDSSKDEMVIDEFAVETVKDYIEFSYQGYLKNIWKKYNQALYGMSVKYKNYFLERKVGEVLRELLLDLNPEVMAELWDLAEQADNIHLLRGVWWYFAKRWCKMPSSKFPGLNELLQRNPMYKHYFCQYMSEREYDQLLDLEYDTKEADKLEKRVAELEQQLDEIR